MTARADIIVDHRTVYDDFEQLQGLPAARLVLTSIASENWLLSRFKLPDRIRSAVDAVGHCRRGRGAEHVVGANIAV